MSLGRGKRNEIDWKEMEMVEDGRGGRMTDRS